MKHNKSYLCEAGYKLFQHVPKLFARESELSGRKCGIMIRDEERSWPFRLFYRGRHTFIGGEWRKFCAVNLLKEGDRILFEIFSNGEKPVLKIYGKFHILCPYLIFIHFSAIYLLLSYKS